MGNVELYIKQINMLNNFLKTGAMSLREYEISMGGLSEKMGYLIKDTTREEREQIVAESLGLISGSCDGCIPGLFDAMLCLLDEKRSASVKIAERY